MTITIPDKLYFKIGEVAKMADVPTHVLRYWESEFSGIKPKRANSKQRLYRRQDVELILKIKTLLHDQGYTIAGARKLILSGKEIPEPVENENQTADPASIKSRESEIIVDIARDAAYLSLGITKKPELQGLLAYQSYLLHKEHAEEAFDRDIYSGLYDALKKLIKQSYYIYPSLRNSIKAMEWINGSGSVLVALSDGSIKILSGNIANKAVQIPLVGTGFNNECIGISPDERIAVTSICFPNIAIVHMHASNTVIGSINLIFPGSFKSGKETISFNEAPLSRKSERSLNTSPTTNKVIKTHNNILK